LTVKVEGGEGVRAEGGVGGRRCSPSASPQGLPRLFVFAVRRIHAQMVGQELQCVNGAPKPAATPFLLDAAGGFCRPRGRSRRRGGDRRCPRREGLAGGHAHDAGEQPGPMGSHGPQLAFHRSLTFGEGRLGGSFPAPEGREDESDCLQRLVRFASLRSSALPLDAKPHAVAEMHSDGQARWAWAQRPGPWPT